MMYICIYEVPYSSLRMDTGYLDRLFVVFPVLPSNVRYSN